MALKTNSRKARENVRGYILKYFRGGDYSEIIGESLTAPQQDFARVAAYTLKVFRTEKLRNGGLAYYGTEERAFAEWAAGLPGVLDTLYFYYNRDAVDDLGAILEETEEEKNRFTETDAANLLTRLIYWELIRGEAEYKKQQEEEQKNRYIYLASWNNCGYMTRALIVDRAEHVANVFGPCCMPINKYKKVSKRAILTEEASLKAMGYRVLYNV